MESAQSLPSYLNRSCKKAITRLQHLEKDDMNADKMFLWAVKNELDKAACSSENDTVTDALWTCLFAIRDNKSGTTKDIKEMLEKCITTIDETNGN